MKISDLLEKTKTMTDIKVTTSCGSIAEVARMLGVERQTVRRYKDRPNDHIIIQDGKVLSLFRRVGG